MHLENTWNVLESDCTYSLPITHFFTTLNHLFLPFKRPKLCFGAACYEGWQSQGKFPFPECVTCVSVNWHFSIFCLKGKITLFPTLCISSVRLWFIMNVIQVQFHTVSWHFFMCFQGFPASASKVTKVMMCRWHEQTVSHLFVQVSGQDVCFVEQGDVTLPPEETHGSIQRAASRQSQREIHSLQHGHVL